MQLVCPTCSRSVMGASDEYGSLGSHVCLRGTTTVSCRSPFRCQYCTSSRKSQKDAFVLRFVQDGQRWCEIRQLHSSSSPVGGIESQCGSLGCRYRSRSRPVTRRRTAFLLLCDTRSITAAVSDYWGGGSIYRLRGHIGVATSYRWTTSEEKSAGHDPEADRNGQTDAQSTRRHSDNSE